MENTAKKFKELTRDDKMYEYFLVKKSMKVEKDIFTVVDGVVLASLWNMNLLHGTWESRKSLSFFTYIQLSSDDLNKSIIVDSNSVRSTYELTDTEVINLIKEQ